MRFLRQPLWLILAAFVALSAVYVWAIPPLEGSDEFEHFAYVTWLIEQRAFPIQGEAGWLSPVRQESGQPPLYYWLASLPARLAGTQPPVVFRPNPYFRYELDPVRPDNKNTALHYPADAGGGWRGLYFARIVSMASGVLLIIAVYGLTDAVLPHRPGVALGAAAFTAFMPQVLFHSSHVSNDILAAAFATLALWQLARIVRFGGRSLRGLSLGAALGAAALVKVNTLVIGLPVALGLAWLWLGRDRGNGRAGAAETVRTSAAAALGFGAVAGWWFLRSWRLYGSFLGLDTHCYQQLATCGPIGLVRPNPVAWRDTFRSFWAAFGLANIRPPDWVYWFFAALLGLAAAGLIWLLSRRQRARHGNRTAATDDAHLPVLLMLMAVALAGNLLLLYVWMQQILAAYGRLLFPSLGAIIVLLSAGLWELHPRLARWAWLLPCILAVAAPFWLIRPAYARPQFLDDARVIEKGSLGWRYGDVAELISVTPLARSAAAGETLPVEICWRPLERTETNYTVFLQAVGPAETIVADRYTYPGLGSYPTAIWEPGRAFCDVVPLPIPPTLARTLLYRLSVGLLDDTTDQRLPVVDAAGNAPPFVGAVRLAAATLAPEEQPPPGDAAIRLAGAEFAPSWPAGSEQRIALRWFAAAAVPVDYTIFLHLRDAAGQLVAQADGPPLADWYPTSGWSPGEWVVDDHSFTLPSTLSPGVYQLVAGLYDPLSGERMGEEQRLGTVEIVSGDRP
ncbi:MAG: glycosyltransferase family 39 protein [Candidatus Promineofilum sp.]|nr:glycosyltransferase family 39 protein [Promineifilum sp.]